MFVAVLLVTSRKRCKIKFGRLKELHVLRLVYGELHCGPAFTYTFSLLQHPSSSLRNSLSSSEQHSFSYPTKTCFGRYIRLDRAII